MQQYPMEVVYVTIRNPAFCLFLYLTGVHFRGELQHVGDVVSKKSSADQSELEKQVVSDCKTDYMYMIYYHYVDIFSCYQNCHCMEEDGGLFGLVLAINL